MLPSILESNLFLCAHFQALHQQKIKQMQEEFEVEKTRSLKEMSDQLSRDHHSQLEGLRSRFRLMACTTPDRPPSESSFDKTEVHLISSSAFVTMVIYFE